jgi:hypothetical protein
LNPITPTITWAQPAAIAYGTPLSGILNAIANDGSTSVSGTFVYTATPQGGTASVVTTTTVLGTGQYTLAVSFTPSNNITYTSASGGVSLTVNKVAPSVELASSANPALVSNNVTLTAIASSNAGTPTGSVEFYDGTTLLGSGTLASGSATYATSTLSSGTHSITAVYGGDSNFSSVTSSAVSQVVSDLTLEVASGGTSTATVLAGGTATYHLTLTPSTGSVFPAAVSLTASGGPSGSTITITPQAIAAGAGTTNVVVTVQLPAATAVVRRNRPWALGFALPLLGMLALPFGIKCRRRPLKRVFFAGLLLIVFMTVGAMLGCGDNPRPAPSTPQPTSYNVTVTAASGSVSHSTTLTVTVQ